MLSMKTGINKEYVHSPRGPKVNRTDRKFNTRHLRFEGGGKKKKDYNLKVKIHQLGLTLTREKLKRKSISHALKVSKCDHCIHKQIL